MEGSKAVDSSSSSSLSSSSSSSSSISSDLFGGKESSASGNRSSTTGIFSSVFPPPSTILDRNILRSDALGSLRKQDSELQVGNAKHAYAGQSSDSKSRSGPYKDMSSAYPYEAADPCSLSSSLHYGGRDHCVHSSNSRGPVTPDSDRKYEKDGEDDLNSSDIASRGNWWQGSLYY